MRVVVLHQALPAGAGPDERDVLVQVESVRAALAELGHEPLPLSVELDLERARAELASLAPDLVFNLVESLGGEGSLLHFVPALLRSLQLRFTGAGAEALLLSTDKLAARCRLAAAGHRLPLSDLILATVALRLAAEIYTTDPHFDLIGEVGRFSA